MREASTNRAMSKIASGIIWANSHAENAFLPGAVADLKVWQTLLLKVGPEGYLFPSERETPLRRDNVWKRDLQPALERVGRAIRKIRRARVCTPLAPGST